MTEDEAMAPIIEDAKEENAAIAAKEAEEAWHVCGRCDKRFESAVALRMHKMRVHTEAGRIGTAHGGQKAAINRNKARAESAQAREKRLEVRRAYQRKIREDYYAQGRDSKGNLKPKGWTPRPYGGPGHSRPKPSYSSTLTGKAREEYLIKQRAYQRNHYRKKRAEVAAVKAGEVAPSTSTISSDITGEAAKAILLAAKVIRGVATSLKLP